MEDEGVVHGGVQASEYDYLLSLPLWSLSEEKVNDLVKQANLKKQEFDKLHASHIFELWNNDLEDFLEALDKQQAIEEKDRIAHKNAGWKGGSGSSNNSKVTQTKRKPTPAAI
jgi:DNA topoisomerase-2